MNAAPLLPVADSDGLTTQEGVIGAGALSQASIDAAVAGYGRAERAAFRLGWAASRDGRPVSDCPVTFDSLDGDRLARAWVRGWAHEVVAANALQRMVGGQVRWWNERPVRLGARRPRFPWARAEVLALERFHVERLPLGHQAAALGRTLRAIYMLRHRLRVVR